VFDIIHRNTWKDVKYYIPYEYYIHKCRETERFAWLVNRVRSACSIIGTRPTKINYIVPEMTIPTISHIIYNNKNSDIPYKFNQFYQFPRFDEYEYNDSIMYDSLENTGEFIHSCGEYTPIASRAIEYMGR